jgi:TonB family protein
MLFTLVFSVALAAQPVSPVQPADSVRPDNDVRLVALRHASEIQRCYETHGLRVNPGLGGTIEVEVTVLPSGRVGGASVTASSLAGAGRAEVEACITMAVKNWRFERGPVVTETIVYPVNLVRNRGTAVNTSVSSD